MTNYWIPPLVNSKDGVDFAMLFPLWASSRGIAGLRPNTSGKPEDFRFCVAEGSK